jgi:hypothetical protein
MDEMVLWKSLARLLAGLNLGLTPKKPLIQLKIEVTFNG